METIWNRVDGIFIQAQGSVSLRKRSHYGSKNCPWVKWCSRLHHKNDVLGLIPTAIIFVTKTWLSRILKCRCKSPRRHGVMDKLLACHNGGWSLIPNMWENFFIISFSFLRCKVVGNWHYKFARSSVSSWNYQKYFLSRAIYRLLPIDGWAKFSIGSLRKKLKMFQLKRPKKDFLVPKSMKGDLSFFLFD